MKIGIGILPTPPLPLAEQFVREAEELGLAGVFLPDRIMSWFPRSTWQDVGNIAELMPKPHIFLDPMPLIASWSGVTSRVDFVSSVTDPIRTSPAQIAVTALTLNLLSSGRFRLGIGCGEAANCIPYGLPFDRPVSRLEDALRVIRAMWNEESADLVTRNWTLNGAVFDVEPHLGAFPPIWIGAHRDRMLKITGQYGDGWLPFIPMAPEEYEAGLRTVRLAAEAAGRDPAGITAAFNTPVCIADTHEQAHSMMASFAARQFLLVMPREFWDGLGIPHPLGIDHGVTELIPEALTEGEIRAALANVPDPMIAHDRIIHGTPDEVADQLVAYEEAGLEYFAPLDTSPLTDLAAVPGMVRRVGRIAELLGEVIP